MSTKNNNKFYNWYAGNHCYPKCSHDKIFSCREKIRKAIENTQINSHREFVYLIRGKHKICDLSQSEYVRNVYKEPLCLHRYKQALEKMNDKQKQLFIRLEELTLLLLWLTSWQEEIVKGQSVRKSWRGYDFNVLDSLLEKDYISFSYGSKSVLLRDKGTEKAKELVKKYEINHEGYL